MSVIYSTGAKKFLQAFGSWKVCFEGGKLCFYSGTKPTTNAAIDGTLLLTLTNAGAAHTNETPSRGKVTFTSAADAETVTGITVNSVQIMSGTVTCASDTTTTLAAKVAANINAFGGKVRYRTWNVTNILYIEAMPGQGTVPNGYVVASTGTALRTDANMADGVAGANGLLFGTANDSSIISASGVWQGTNAATGMASYAVLFGPNSNDTGLVDATPYPYRRIIFSCGLVGSDIIMASTTLTISKTHSLTQGDIEFSS